MKTIELTKGKVALVDDSWYDELSQYKWHASYEPHTKSFYALRNSPSLFGKRKRILMHRVIMNTLNGMQVDHIDHDTLNNQTANLRNCTHSENMHNSRKPGNNTSGYKGVSWNRKRKEWCAQIRLGKVIFLGYFTDPIEAATAYDQAAKELHGEFARLNFAEDENAGRA